MIPAIGIDLGTTFSVVGRLTDRGELVSIPNMEGDRLTPSVVFFDDQNVIVGKEAVKAMAIDAGRAAPCSKREVGLRVYHKAFDGQQYPPEVIEAWILNKLRVDTAAQIGPFEKAVITVPAYFDEVRRKATQDAGYMAGLDVMDIINEPTAAATAFGFGRGMIQAQRPTERFVVYDLGGGTFDVTVMELRGTDFIALATDGDTGLGGYDWDQRLVNLVVERFRDQHGIDPREDPNAAGHLWQQCEDAKRTLSSREKATVVCNYRGFSSRVEITRRQFDDATRDLLDITRTTTDRTVRAAGLDWPQIDRVLLVGGSTRMPQVRDMLRQLSGREPDASVAADEVVAYGAALHADLLLAASDGRPTSHTIRNVNSHSLGVVGKDPRTGQNRNGIVIPRNTAIPISRERVFRTERHNQRSVVVQVVEGESPLPDDCTPIGQFAIDGLPPLPAGSPVVVSFHYECNGRLNVQVALPGTNRQVAAEIKRAAGLDKQQLDGWRRYISGMEPTDH